MKKTNKTTLLIILGAILIISLILFNNKGEDYYNTDIAFNNTETFVVDKTDNSYLDTVVRTGLDILDIKPQVVIIRPLIEGKYGEGYEYFAKIHYIENQCLIYVSKMGRRSSIHYLSHELIHLRDYMNGDLVVNDSIVKYKGIIYYENNMPTYSDRPWERTAFKDGSSLERKIKRKLYK